MESRRRQTDEVCRTSFDVIIIGAGINGAGIARDAALRGLPVLLLDQSDIGGGTSSASTRLIHGGLRYLEYGELGLVHESLGERETLLRIAPHLVKPLPILIPIYEGATRGTWTIRAGLTAYDLLALFAGRKSVPRHRMLSRREALNLAPGLNTAGLCGAALYFDAQVEFAERLVLENAQSAQAEGATIQTYARVDKLIVEQQVVRGVTFTDLRTNQPQTALGRITINAAGPWVDQLAGGVGAERLIGGTKGSHLVVAPFPGAPETALYVEAATDRRPFFVIPWNGNYLIGTTDSRYEGDPGAVEIDDQEIEYLLAETNRVVPSADLTRASILFTFSGVRPLAFSRGESEQRITRRHFLHDHSPQIDGFISVVGGKLTTYRSLAEQAVNLVFRKLKILSPPCTTAKVPLPGAVTPAGTNEFAVFREQFAAESGLTESSKQRLLRIYGTRASEIIQLARVDPRLAVPLSNASSAIAAEVVFSFQQELAQTLADCLLRRTMIGISDRPGMAEAEAAARVAREHLGWSAERAEQEVNAYRKIRLDGSLVPIAAVADKSAI